MSDAPLERPTTYTDKMNRAAAEKMADQLISQNGFSKNRESIVIDLLKSIYHWHDGYNLAKDLESYSYWDVDAEVVATLSDMYGLRLEEKERCEKEWVKQTNPQPTFSVGDEVSFQSAIDGLVTGPIHSIYEDLARYVVDVKRTGTGGILVPYENVRAA
ncbi:MAG: hypothetical protein CL472_05105 [Acidobacteria bacterium]|nr:hypothetical protein [Acidobacteriota bacterium]